MLVVVGSLNQIKINGVIKALQGNEMFSNLDVVPFDAKSGVNKQPKSMIETFNGAKNRAFHTYVGANGLVDYSIGIENGLIDSPIGGLFEITACVIYDGKIYTSGISQGYQCPNLIAHKVYLNDMDLNEAFYSSGLTKNIALGNSEGAIGLLTKGVVTREDQIASAVLMAIIPFQNESIYQI